MLQLSDCFHYVSLSEGSTPHLVAQNRRSSSDTHLISHWILLMWKHNFSFPNYRSEISTLFFFFLIICLSFLNRAGFFCWYFGIPFGTWLWVLLRESKNNHSLPKGCLCGNQAQWWEGRGIQSQEVSQTVHILTAAWKHAIPQCKYLMESLYYYVLVLYTGWTPQW